MATPCGQTVMQVSSCLTRDEGVWEDISSPIQQALLVSGRRGTLYLPVEWCRAFTYVDGPSVLCRARSRNVCNTSPRKNMSGDPSAW